MPATEVPVHATPAVPDVDTTAATRADSRADTPPSPSTTTAPALDLPRLVMRRAAWVALAALLLGVVAGFIRAGTDIRDETRAAIGLATTLRDLSRAGDVADGELAAVLERARRDGALRHVDLRLVDARGVTRLEPARTHDGNPWVDGLMALHSRWQRDDQPAPRSLAWPVARSAEASPWTATLVESREDERREAMANLGSALLIAVAAAAAMLAVMAWNVRRAFAPLRELVGRIASLREPREPHQQPRERLPAMPVRELQVVADAVQRLDDDLALAQTQRRDLSLKLLTLQEDERARLARELHDEFGQRLTAMRVDLAWLARRVGTDATAAEVVAGMAHQCELVQQDLRGVLARLRPLGVGGNPGESGGNDRSRDDDENLDQSASATAVAELPRMLAPLLAAWDRPQTEGPRCRLDLEAIDAAGERKPWDEVAPGATMPSALALAIYRMTQEALTNVARHAEAQEVRVRLELDRGRARPRLSWSAEDDGRGLLEGATAQARGSGLGGMRERAWAHGAELQLGAARAEPARPGVRLAASFVLPEAP